MVSLSELGFAPSSLVDVDLCTFLPGRVVEEQKHAYRVLTEEGALWTRAAGRLMFTAAENDDRGALPAVGDFVLVRRESGMVGEGWRHIERVLPRRSCLRRKAAGLETAQQVIAANVDVVFLVNAMGLDLNVRRLERYLLAVWDSGALPVVLLSKGDLEADRTAALADVTSVCLGASVHVVSAQTGEGLDLVRSHLGPGRSAVFVGSSGVGKSTLINSLLGYAALATQSVRDSDDKGRHTTSHRSLWLLPDGGMIVDTPGMRELMPWSDDEGVGQVYADVQETAARCRFSDCRHADEPGCAVQAAVAAGQLDAGRLAAFAKARREQAYLDRKVDHRLASAERRKWKHISKLQRQHYKEGK